MNKRSFLWLFAILVIGILAFTVIIVRADDDKPVSTEEAPSFELGGGWAHYAFTGVRTSSTIATVVHCTNPDDVPLNVLVQIDNYNLNVSYGVNMAIPPYHTRTVSFDSGGDGTFLFSEDYYVNTVTQIGQGRGAIYPQVEGAPFYCAAQLLDKNGLIPNFVVDLPIIPVDADGFPYPPGLLRANYLPSVLND